MELKRNAFTVSLSAWLFCAWFGGLATVQAGAADHCDHWRGGEYQYHECRGEDERGRRGEEGRGLGRDRVGRDFKALDADSDGQLSFEEFSKSERLKRIDQKKRKKLFSYLDKNEDGQLHLSELKPPPPRWMVGLTKDFNALDADKNKGLDFFEFSKSPHMAKFNEDDRTRMFKSLDRNKDQRIQLDEISGHPGHKLRRPHGEIDLKTYDANQSGGLDYEEYSNLPWREGFPDEIRIKIFKKMDLNNDGEVSPDEIHQARRRLSIHGRPRAPRGEKGPGKRPENKDKDAERSKPPKSQGAR